MSNKITVGSTSYNGKVKAYWLYVNGKTIKINKRLYKKIMGGMEK